MLAHHRGASPPIALVPAMPIMRSAANQTLLPLTASHTGCLGVRNAG